MKLKLIIKLSILIAVLFIGIGCDYQNPDDFTALRGPYLGQTPPDMTAELFAPEIYPEGEIQGCSGFLNEGTVFVFGSSLVIKCARAHSSKLPTMPKASVILSRSLSEIKSTTDV